jgi:hypothetical protein
MDEALRPACIISTASAILPNVLIFARLTDAVGTRTRQTNLTATKERNREQPKMAERASPGMVRTAALAGEVQLYTQHCHQSDRVVAETDL